MNITPIDRVDEVPPIQTNIVTPIANEISLTIPNNILFRSDEAFMVDIIRAFEQFGFNISANLALNNNTTLDDSTNTTVSDVLDKFVHSLQAALNQIQTPSSSPREENEEVNPNPSTQASETDTGFTNFISDLLFLMNTNSSTNTQLQSNFDTLVRSLLPNSSAVTGNPSLSEFLNMMITDANDDQNNQHDAGTTFATKV
jgi:hypothetical protein